MAKNSFRDLQTIYEDYRGQAINFPNNSQYTPPRDNAHSYNTSFNDPGSSRGMVTTAIPSDEENYTVTIQEIKNKIEELMEEADAAGMTYATNHLLDLLNFIKKGK